jgi:hypothetical protein
MVYQYGHSETETLEGYINFTLSTFDVADFQNQSIPSEVPAKFGEVKECR